MTFHSCDCYADSIVSAPNRRLFPDNVCADLHSKRLRSFSLNSDEQALRPVYTVDQFVHLLRSLGNWMVRNRHDPSVTAAVLVPVLILLFPPPVKAGRSIWSMLAVLRQPIVWQFGILLFFESGNENCMFVWASKIVADVIHTTARRANLALLALSLSLGFGRLLAILWVRWLGNVGTIWFSSALILFGSLFTMNSGGFVSMIAGLAIIGLGLSAIFPTTLAIAGDYFPSQTGTVFGAIMTLALIGGASGPAVASVAVVHGPLKVLWIPAMCAIAVAVLAAFV